MHPRVLASLILVALSSGCVGELTAPGDPEQDQGTGVDLGAKPAADMTPTPDLSPGADMQSGEDMLPGADMARMEDMTSGEDMSEAGDMSSTADMPAVEDMSPPTYQGVRSGQFTRRDCQSGCAGSLVRYTSTQTSLTSVEDAERLAHADVLANGQANADAQGTCDCAPATCGCEDFSNHGPAGPHLYYDAVRGVLTGDVIASCAPLFWVEGLTQSYERMDYIGSIPGASQKVYRYTVAADTTGRNVHLKSAGDGCQDYPDVRLQPLDPRVRDAWGTLPQLPAVTPSTEEIPFFFASELENSEGDAFVWGIFTLQPWENMQYRVDGGSWTSFKAPEQWGVPTVGMSFTHVSTETIKPLKDFIFDITRDGGTTVQRFTVFRTSKGGHYSTLSTATRQDGRVWLTAQLSYPESPQYLVHEQTGKIYPSHAPYHYLFDLGFLPEGEHRFSLWSGEDVFIDDQVLVKVKITP